MAQVNSVDVKVQIIKQVLPLIIPLFLWRDERGYIVGHTWVFPPSVT